MSERELVIQHITAQIVVAFTEGRLLDAQTMNMFLASVEQMTDEEYLDLVTEEQSGAIS